MTEDEKPRMCFLLKKIEDDVVDLALYDLIITREEDALLVIIKKTVEDFFIDGNMITSNSDTDPFTC